MNISYITPTRGDRPLFVDLCRTYMERQTIKNSNHKIQHFFIDYAPKSQEPDLAARYTKGLQKALDAGADLIFFIEDDDWYGDRYIEYMVDQWNQNEQPDLFGFNKTIYYYLPTGKIWYIDHPKQSSMFNTAITKNLAQKIIDENTFLNSRHVYLDIVTWKLNVTKMLFEADEKYCIGLKHGKGLTAGPGHQGEFWRYEADPNYEKIQGFLGNDFNHYKHLLKTPI